ncbi:MAG: hypothetical protein UY81_C0002G0018 [Candidatus Giovannonibacteria bacterium GW2011_GWA2_53_7]|uniref:Uncharacterized protein n=1 Tax=Candidatus Giovannonibacteria bacterium GW2011_GWA2_53_7 TaxID=1618650 RepID=A0A0G1Y203_9BACT|nr:MAG: hypothetical protein UY81_C0002G0018 [Candidatus Giovannonibacteria bacterium GW2011_GWA2_53_7]
MRRIWLMWAIRRTLNPMTLKAAIALTFVWRSTAYVSYGNVFANAPQLSDLSRNITFAQSAIVHAETATLFLVFGALLVGVWLAFDLLRQKSPAFF